MASLLPTPFGCGTRNNNDKRKYVFDHLGDIEYRTLACSTPEEAKECERNLKTNSAEYKFKNLKWFEPAESKISIPTYI